MRVCLCIYSRELGGMKVYVTANLSVSESVREFLDNVFCLFLLLSIIVRFHDLFRVYECFSITARVHVMLRDLEIDQVKLTICIGTYIQM